MTTVLGFMLLVWVVCLAGLAGLFWFVMSLFGRLSGWSRLAARYRAPRTFSMRGLARQSVGVGPIRFRNSVMMAPAPEGLYLATYMLRPPLLIPWDEFTAAHPMPVYGRTAVRLSIGRPDAGSITVWPQQLLAMRAYLKTPVT